uniref:TWiK family of potassium channels protein 7 n=1 Tax=Cacopsylla melanoneura TaxID=428564 RepID=A0A8D8M2S0_9HEMI
MSTVTVTEITETESNDAYTAPVVEDYENAYIVEEVKADDAKADEKGEETDDELDAEGVKEVSDGTKRKKKKLRGDLSTSQRQRAGSGDRADVNNGVPQGYSSSEETENKSTRFKRNQNNTATIRRRIIKKTADKEENKERSRRGKSEPKELIKTEVNEAAAKEKSKRTWWPWNRSKNDHRLVQTDGEQCRSKNKSDESSDEFWKSGSFRMKRKSKTSKQVKSVEDVRSKPAVSDQTQQPVKPTPPVSSIVTKEILTDEITVEIIPEPPPVQTIPSWWQFKTENAVAWRRFVTSRNRCISLFLGLCIYLGLGALAIRFIEGAFENFYKCGVKRVKRDFIDTLWDRRYGSEDEWKSLARRTLLNFENELHTAFEAGMKSYSGAQSWSFINSFLYCLQVVSTIGYGNISPSTSTGRWFTIAYAIFGIPLFLIVLADFGKLFTRGIKFMWAYVRRVYYTGSCRKVRRTAPVQEVMKGVKMVVDVAQNLRRPSQVMSPEEQKRMGAFGNQTPGTGGATPALSSYEIDEEFNLPISLALLILLLYIFTGAVAFVQWEKSWSVFDSFWFVFVSMSTIGFGDIVPQNPKFMMATVGYLIFGLALTSMCINVVQEKLSDSFRQASAKIGATIGFQVEEDTGVINPVSVAPSNDLPAVHRSTPKDKKKS